MTKRNPFSIDQIIKARKSTVSITPKATQVWVKSLHTADIGKTAQAVFYRLNTLLLEPLGISDRIDTLDMIDNVVRMVTVQLHERFMGQALPLPKMDLVVADLVQDLSLKMVLGYKLVLNDIDRSSSPVKLLKKNQLRHACQRIQYYLGRLSLTRCLIYRPPALNLWSEINNNYDFSVAHQLESKPVKMIDSTKQGMSVEDLYKQSLLFSLANPHRLSQRDMMRLFNALRRWVSYCKLEKIEHGINPKKAPFVILTGDDNGPVYSQIAENREEPQGFYIITADLAAQLAGELDEKDDQSAGGRLRPVDSKDFVSISLLSRLMLVWGMGLKRHAQRMNCNQTVNITIGLPAIYRMLGGPELDYSQSDGYGVSVSDDEEVPRVKDISRAGDAIEWGDDEAVDEIAGMAERSGSSAEGKSTFRICDTSQGGMLLVWEGKGRPQLHVGELIGLRLSDAMERVTVCVIRWVRADKYNRFQCGVELLLKEPEFSYLQISRKDGMSERLPVICEEDSSQKIVSLVTSCFFANADDLVSWKYRGNVLPLSLEGAMDCTGAFLMFRIEVEREKPSIPEADVNEKGGADYFDDLWSLL